MSPTRSFPRPFLAIALLASVLTAFASHASPTSKLELPHLQLEAPETLRLASAQDAPQTSPRAEEGFQWPLMPTLLPFSPRVGVPPSLHFGQGGRTLTQEVIDHRVADGLSTMWLSVTALMIGADVLSLYVPSSVEEFHALANGEEKWLMLAGISIYLMPASMALLSKMLPRTANRIVNVLAVALIATALVGGGNFEPHYLVATGAQLTILSLITYNAVFWPAAIQKELESTSVGLTIRPDKEQYGFSFSRTF